MKNNPQHIMAPLLARIPDIRQLDQKHSASEAEGLSSRGRLFDQLVSFKLLMLVTVSLIVLAMAPWFFHSKTSTTNVNTVKTDTLPSWSPSSDNQELSSSIAKSQMAATHSDTRSITKNKASNSKEIVESVQERPESVANSAITGVVQEKNKRRENSDIPLMSPWPNPEHPVVSEAENAVQAPRIGVNQAMAINPNQQTR